MQKVIGTLRIYDEAGTVHEAVPAVRDGNAILAHVRVFAAFYASRAELEIEGQVFPLLLGAVPLGIPSGSSIIECTDFEWDRLRVALTVPARQETWRDRAIRDPFFQEPLR